MASPQNTGVYIKMHQMCFKRSINKLLKNHGVYLLLSCLSPHAHAHTHAHAHAHTQTNLPGIAWEEKPE